jgi:NADH:ubiquinone oxidoreductase subunit 4 (subunit M)
LILLAFFQTIEIDWIQDISSWSWSLGHQVKWITAKEVSDTLLVSGVSSPLVMVVNLIA